jgi:dipeptidyl aminopeptidase/acylaminoacyl peptidase
VHFRPLHVMTAFLAAMILVTRPAVALGQAKSTIHASGGVPAVPGDLDATIDRYRFSASGELQGWLAATRQILYLATSDGMDQVFVCSRPGEPPWQLSDTKRPVAWAYSDPRRSRVIIAQDNQGNEQHWLTLVDLRTGRHQKFTNGQWENRGVLWSRSGHMVALTSNARNGKDGDLYVIDPARQSTGRRLKNASGMLFAESWSPDDRRLAAVEYPPDLHEARVHLIDVETGQTETLPQPSGAPVKRANVRWSADGHSLYWLTDRGSEFFYPAKYDLANGAETKLMGDAPWDVESLSLADDGTVAVLVVNEDGRSRLVVIDPRTGRQLPAPRFAEGIISSVMFRRESHEFAFEWSCAQSPPGIYSYDVETGEKTEWLKPEPADRVSGSLPSHVRFRYPSFDRRLIPAYIRRPGPGFKGRRPVVVLIHGGPAAHYSPGFSLLENYLLGELGIAVIMPNIRGSTGYGRSYEQLDNERLRPDAVRDLGALLDWISTQPDLDASRVAVRGASHGGYLALAALAEFGNRLRCGIDIAGVSGLETSLQFERDSAIDYWRAEYGDERDRETREFLRSISPVTRAERIRKPLLVVHSENDPRVKIGEADQIVSAVQRNGTIVWYVWFNGEGHSLDRREHAVYQMEVEILFLKTFLLLH